MSESRDVPEKLIAAAMAGDRSAIEDLLGVIRPLVRRYCHARLAGVDRTSVSADDVTQEVCLAVLTALPGYRVQGRPFLAFVYGIASHKVIDAHRAASRNRSEPVADVPDRAEDDHGPESRAFQFELSERMSKLLEILPEKHREIITLRLVVGLSVEETAEVVGSAPGAVRVAQHRALTRLRKSMTEEELIAVEQGPITDGFGDAATFHGSTVVQVVPPPARLVKPLPQPGYTVEPTDELSITDEERLRSQLAEFNEELGRKFDVETGLDELQQIAEYRRAAADVPWGIDVEARLNEVLTTMKEDNRNQNGQ